MKRIKKIELVLLMISLVVSFGFAENWTPVAGDVDNQVINLMGSIEPALVTGMTLQGSLVNDFTSTGTIVGNGSALGDFVLDDNLDLVGGGVAYFNLINASNVNVDVVTSYSCAISITPFKTSNSTGVDDYDQEAVTLKSWNPGTASTEIPSTEHFTATSTLSTEVLPEHPSTGTYVNLKYLPGQTAAGTEFLNFSVGWDGSDTLSPGNYTSTVTASFAAYHLR